MTDTPPLSTRVVLAVVVVTVLGGLALDTFVVDRGAPTVATAEQDLRAGSTTCAAMALDASSDVTATTVAVPTEDVDDAEVRLQLVADGDVRDLADPPVDGSAVATSVAGGAAPAALTARWDEAPLLLSRRWSVDDTQRVPGTVEGPCPQEPAASWFVPGVVTAGGASAVLHVANPTAGSASLSVSFTTPDGALAPTRLANLAVPAHSTTTVDLNEFAPEEPDLGVVVQARAGRVVVEALQTLEAAVGGVDGRSLVVAHPVAAETWTIPWVRAGDDESAWVWVTNPGEAATDVRLVLHTPTGPVVPPDSGVTLPPGTTRRIDLRGALAEVGTAAVTVRSAPGVPVVASGAVLRVVEDDAIRGGIAVVEAAPAASGSLAALSAVGATGRERTLVLANPGEEDALVDVRVVGNRVDAGRTAASAVLVAAGAVTEVELDADLPLEGGFAVVVEVTQGAVTGTMVATDVEGPLDLVAVAVRPFPTTVTTPEPVPVRDRSLLHPLDRDDLLEVVGQDGVDASDDVDAVDGDRDVDLDGPDVGDAEATP